MRICDLIRTPVKGLALAFVWSLNAIAAGSEPVCYDGNGQPVSALVASAETALSTAAERNALWTVAVDALRRAQEALSAGACDRAMREAEAAIAYAELGIGQLDYPAYRIR